MLGWYGSSNTGDEAVLEAIVSALRAHGVPDLHVLSIDPTTTSSRLGIPSSPRALTSLRTLRVLRHARALVLGGGGLIQDRTSVYNLPLYALFVMLARIFGARVIGWGLGVEPIDTLLGKVLARFIVSSSDYCSVRDPGSKRLLVRAGARRGLIRVTSDPAFLIRPVCSAEGREESRPRVVFCLRDLPENRPGLNLQYLLPMSVKRRIPFGRRREQERRASNFVEAIAHGVVFGTRELGAKAVFLPLWPGRDEAIATKVMRRAIQLGAPSEAIESWTAPATPRAVAGAMGRADLLVSMRLHALIFGAEQRVPLLALAYARKDRGLMRLLGAERWVIEVEKRTPSREEVVMKLSQLWELRASARETVCVHAAAARLRAEEDARHIAGMIR